MPPSPSGPSTEQDDASGRHARVGGDRGDRGYGDRDRGDGGGRHSSPAGTTRT